MPVNETSVQLLKILASQNKRKKSKKRFVQTIYPRGIENKYKSKLTSYFKPLIDYVKKFLSENSADILRGDSTNVKLDAVPGKTYEQMVKNMEAWVAAYLPEDAPADSVIYSGLKDTALQLKQFEDLQFEKQLEKSINTSIKEQADWWPSMSNNWANNNYKLIRSNASAFVDKINMIVEKSVVSGTTVKDLQQEIQKATTGLSDYKCRLLARDQIGKLQGQISQGQMSEIGLDLYIWSTSNDERVRDSHLEMEGKLCRWDDATVYSEDGGKHWIDRPSSAVQMHPGQDIQCRCVALAYFPELKSVAYDEPMEIIPMEESSPLEEYVFKESDFEKTESEWRDMEKSLSFQTGDVMKQYGIDINSIPNYSNDRRAYRYYLRDNLKGTELNSIFRYSDDDYIDINKYVSNKYNGSEPERIKALVKDMDSVMKKGKPLKQNSVFYRFEKSFRHDSWKIGDTITSEIYSSTSISEGSISNFYKPDTDELKFYAKKGTKCGMYIEPISEYDGDEKEFLMKRNLKFKIESVEVLDNRKIWSCLILDD